MTCGHLANGCVPGLLLRGSIFRGTLSAMQQFGMVGPAFSEGKRTIAAGEKLDVLGDTGVTSGIQLYFETEPAEKPVDPRRALACRTHDAARRGSELLINRDRVRRPIRFRAVPGVWQSKLAHATEYNGTTGAVAVNKPMRLSVMHATTPCVNGSLAQ